MVEGEPRKSTTPRYADTGQIILRKAGRPGPSRSKQDEVAEFLRALILVHKRGELKRFPAQDQIAQVLGVSTSTVSTVYNSSEIQALREGQKTPEPQDAIQSPPPAVIAHVRQELEEIASGRRSGTTSYAVLGELYGISPSRVGQLVEEYGLREELAAAREAVRGFRERKGDAWFLGALFGKGRIQRSSVIFTNKNPEVLAAFKNEGEFILQKDGLERQRKNPEIIFYHAGYARLLAPFSAASRVDLLEGNEYKWLKEPEYNKMFFSGLFDALGQVSFPSETSTGRYIQFSTSSDEKVAEFLFERLKLLGIQRPRILYYGRNDRRPKRVFFSSIFDLKIFAENIQSINNEKQAVLNRIKEYVPTEQEREQDRRDSSAQQIFP